MGRPATTTKARPVRTRRGHHPNRVSPFVTPRGKPEDRAKRDAKAAEQLAELMRANPEIDETVRRTRTDPIAVRAIALLAKR